MSPTTSMVSEGKLPMGALGTLQRSMSGQNLMVSSDFGIDVGVSKARGKFIVSSSDPITGTRIRMGWHAVNVSANDVAASGMMPDALNVIALFPKNTRVETIRRIFYEINTTASNLGMSVAGGHTEITPGLNRPIIAVTAMGSGNRFVTSAGAKQYDSILMTKTAGMEGTSILSKLPKVRKLVGTKASRKGSSLIEQLSVVREARTAFKTRKIHAMHDVTEGGILGAAYEMSVASNLGFELSRDSIPIDESTNIVCKQLSLDPLRLIGSGSLLIACPGTAEKYMREKLNSEKIPCTRIGIFLPLKKGRWMVSSKGRKRVSQFSTQDELWNALSKYG